VALAGILGITMAKPLTIHADDWGTLAERIRDPALIRWGTLTGVHRAARDSGSGGGKIVKLPLSLTGNMARTLAALIILGRATGILLNPLDAETLKPVKKAFSSGSKWLENLFGKHEDFLLDPSWDPSSQVEFTEGQAGEVAAARMDLVADVVNVLLQRLTGSEVLFTDPQALEPALRRSSRSGRTGLAGRSTRWLEGRDFDADSERPLVVGSDRVFEYQHWPGWQQALLLLESEVEIQMFGTTGELRVNLERAPLAVYSQLGKDFLLAEFAKAEETRRGLAEFGELIQRCVVEGRERTIPLVGGSHTPPVLRWSSGGHLPIVDWGGREMALLFFRDITPIGWNIANGGSETAEEWFDLDALCGREANEEVMILEFSDRARGEAIRHRMDLGCELSPLEHLHDNLRLGEDRLDLSYATTELSTEQIEGPMRVNVRDDGREALTESMFVSVNPAELGIEVTRVSKVVLDPSWLIIDGETLHIQRKHFTTKRLVRRPVGLFSLAYLTRVQQSSGPLDGPAGRLGVPFSTAESPDCRQLPPPGSDEVVIFDYDINRRRALVAADPTINKAEDDWMNRWEAPFVAALGGRWSPPLLTLLPAAYRVLEQVLSRHR